jgi:hypothetical protein
MKVSGQFHTLAALSRREISPDTHWIEGWVGFRADLDAVEKRRSFLLPGIEPRSFSLSLYRLSYTDSYNAV